MSHITGDTFYGCSFLKVTLERDNLGIQSKAAGLQDLCSFHLYCMERLKI
jgi:hypothetical protein